MGLSNLGLVLNQVRLLNHSTLMVHMLPVSALSAFYVFFTLGFGSLPFVILGEIFPVQSKEKMMLKCYYTTQLFSTSFSKITYQRITYSWYFYLEYD